MFHIAGSKIRVCSAVKQKTHCYAAMVMFLILITVLTVTYVIKRYKVNAFLLVLDNNHYKEAPQSYVARALTMFVRNKYACTYTYEMRASILQILSYHDSSHKYYCLL